MDDFFSKYGWTIVEVIAGLFSVTLIFSIFSNPTLMNLESFQSIDQTTKGAHVTYDIPIVEEGNFIVDNAILEKDSTFNWKDYVHVSTSDSLDILNYVVVIGDVDTSIPGEYTLLFKLNFNGKNIEKEATFYVKDGAE